MSADSGRPPSTRSGRPELVEGQAPGSTRATLTGPRRLLLAGAGVLSVGFAALGIVVPGLPTTIFLIVASYLFTRSCPWLEQHLLRNRLFAPYLRAVDGGAPMPRRARIVALVMMWGSVGASLLGLAAADRLPVWLAAMILVAALGGTAAILALRPRVEPRRLEVVSDVGD